MTLRNIANTDLQVIQDVISDNDKKPRTLLSIIQEGRTNPATIPDPGEIKEVGGQMSRRIPVRLETPDGKKEEAFFTRQTKLRPYSEEIADHYKRESEKYSNNPDSPYVKIAKAISEIDYNKMLKLTSNESVSFILNYYSLPEGRAEVLKDKQLLIQKFQPFISLLPKDIRTKISNVNDASQDKLREYLADTITFASNAAGKEYTSNEVYKIPMYSNTDTRNTALSDVADYLGVGKIIAKSKDFEFSINGKKIKGTLQQKAEGVDIDSIAKGDEFMEIVNKNGNSSFNTAELKRQLSDLMAIDYICGNYDRHCGNMLYQTRRDKKGDLYVVGITGIDNDMSFGEVVVLPQDDPSYKLVSPENMRIMRAETANKILALTPETLNLILADKGLEQSVKEACHKRLAKLQKQISADLKYQKSHPNVGLRNDHILIAKDEDFKKYNIEKLRRNSKGNVANNYFDTVISTKGHIKTLQELELLPEKRNKRKIHYAKAVTPKTNLRFSQQKPQTINVEETKKQIDKASTMLKNLHWKLWGSNKGEFLWMKQSIQKLETRFKEMTAKDNPKEITGENAAELEALFRQLQKAGTKYADMPKHQNARSDAGKDRLKLAQFLSKDFKITHMPQMDLSDLDPELAKEIKESHKKLTNINNLENKFGKKANKNKDVASKQNNKNKELLNKLKKDQEAFQKELDDLDKKEPEKNNKNVKSGKNTSKSKGSNSKDKGLNSKDKGSKNKTKPMKPYVPGM